MEVRSQQLNCPECGERIIIPEAELELNVGVICEACYTPLQVVELDPVVLQVLDVDLDDLDDDDEFEDGLDDSEY